MVEDNKQSVKPEDSADSGAPSDASQPHPAEPHDRPDKARPREGDAPLPRLDFATFVISLNSSALVQLGILANPATGQKEKNLPLAKQTIDLLALLEEKTRGNLTSDEANMLKSILYDLRIIYVKEKA